MINKCIEICLKVAVLNLLINLTTAMITIGLSLINQTTVQVEWLTTWLLIGSGIPLLLAWIVLLIDTIMNREL